MNNFQNMRFIISNSRLIFDEQLLRFVDDVVIGARDRKSRRINTVQVRRIEEDIKLYVQIRRRRNYWYQARGKTPPRLRVHGGSRSSIMSTAR